MNPSWANSRWQWMSGRVSCICSRDVQGAKKAATLFTRKSTELASPCRLQRITLRSGRVHHQMGEAMMGDHALSRRWVGRSGRGYLMWPAGPRVKKAPSTSPQPQPQRPARAREPTFDHHDMCSTSPLHAQPHAEAEASLRPAGRSVARARRVAYVRTSADVWCVRVEYGFWFSLAPRCHVGYGRTMPSYCGNACMRCSSRKGKTEKWERRIIEVRAHMLCWSLPCVCVCVRRPCCYLDVDACIAHAWAHPCSLGSWMDAYMVAKRNQPFRSNSLYSWTKLSMCMLFFPQGLHVYYMLKEI